MKVAFVQTSPVFGQVRKNVEHAAGLVSGVDATLIVLPELFSTGYQFKSRAEAMRLAERSDGYTVGRVVELAREKNAYVVAGFAEKTDKRVYNSSFLAGPSGVMGIYRKAHLFNSEKEIFSTGNTHYKVYDIGVARVGLMICFDWIQPEVTRTLALKGAEVICHPSNLVLPYCPPAMITRSFENRVFSVTCNRVGAEERVRGARLRFIGSSQIVSPNGDVLLRAGDEGEEVGVVDIDPKDARDKSINPYNHVFKDRRLGFYDLGR